MWHQPRALLAILALGVPACVKGPAIVAGSCYDVLVAPWPDSAGYGADTVGLAPPHRIRLTADRFMPDTAAKIIAEVPGVMPSIHSIAVWRRPSPDTVEFVWSTGYIGVKLRLGGPGDSLSGTAQSFFDYRDGDYVHAEASRVDCAAPIPAVARAHRRFEISVPLESGDTLRLGGQPPTRSHGDSITWFQRRLHVDPAGLFAAADSVHSDAHENVITGLTIYYPKLTRVSEVVEQLESVLGTPTWVMDRKSIEGDQLEGAAWSDRYDTIIVWGPERIRVTLGLQRPPT